MRTIKYKFWDKKNKEFPKVLCLSDAFKEYEKNPDRYVPLQFTGLLDKQGKEIYEGDIIQDEGKYKYKVNFANGMFECCMTPLCDWIKDCEVIGNLYENPELLTKQSEVLNMKGGEEVEEIPQMKGTREALDKIVI